MTIGSGNVSPSDMSMRVHEADLVIQDPLDHHQAPQYDQCLHGVGESMCLVRPCHVRRGYQHHGKLSMAGRKDQFMNGPVFQNEAPYEHQHPQGIVNHPWRNLLFPGLGPQPSQNHHGSTIDEP